jgi:integrase
VKNLLEASKRLLTKPKTRKDIVTTDNLIMLCDKYIQSDDILVLRDLAMILIAFAGFLRFDELSSLRCNDVIFHDSHISIRIRKSKTDQYRHGDRIVISKGESVACPYTMLQRYMRVAGLSVTDDTFLFKPCYRSKNVCRLIFKDKPLSYTRARECLILRLKEVVQDLNIGIHSLRAGGATAAANAGINDRCWKRHGRWKGENSKDGYIGDSLEKRLLVTKSLHL